MQDALNELMSYATTLNFVSQGAWGDTEMEAVSSVCEVQSKSRRVVEKGGIVFQIGEPYVLGSFGWVVRNGDQTETWLRAAGTMPR